ncbi:MAG: hypothetical protein ACTSYL_07445 [Candidatus Thorarchaeota archaeon]
MSRTFEFDATCIAMIVLPFVVLLLLAILASGPRAIYIVIPLSLGYLTVVELFLTFFYDIGDLRYVTMTPPVEVDIDREYIHDSFKLAEIDASVFHRIVIDRKAGDEVIIHGMPETTFRDAIVKHWSFSRISRHAHWAVFDDRGENITNAPLASYDGNAYIDIL